MRLENKVAVITGSGAGQGRAAAILFAREGAKVVVSDINQGNSDETAAEIQRSGGTAISVPANVADEDSVRALMAEAVSRFGRIDILYNNAGIAPFADDRYENTELDLWDRIHNVNLRGVFLGTKYAIPSMVENNRGSIINTASVAGLIGIGGQLAYSASKAGVIGLTKATATTYGRHNIRCNAICPGAIETAMTESVLASERTRQATMRGQCIRRLGTADDIAKLALFLASDESEWMTGDIIPIDGGWTNK